MTIIFNDFCVSSYLFEYDYFILILAKILYQMNEKTCLFCYAMLFVVLLFFFVCCLRYCIF